VLPPADYLEHFNQTLFLALNAPHDLSPFMLAATTFCADYVIFIVPLALVWLWLRDETVKRGGMVVAVLASQIGLFINQLIPYIWVHPRPSAIPLGNTLIAHAADSSFPSDHVTFMTAITLGLWLYAKHRPAAIFTGSLTIVVAWARIYAGVHFPLDMIGAGGVALVSVVAVRPLESWIVDVVMPMLFMPLYRLIFAWPIRHGWCRP